MIMISNQKILSFLILLYIRLVECQLFTEITDSLFENDSEGFIAAYADFNSDKRTDVFVITQDGRSVNLFLAGKNGRFTSKTIISSIRGNMTRVTSVMPADFDGDSQTDVLLTLQSLDRRVALEIYWGNGENFPLDTSTRISDGLVDQPLVMDFNGDLIPDLFGETEPGIRFFWYIRSDRTIVKKEFINGTSSEKLPVLWKYQSSSFSDWDGNLTPDLLIASIDPNNTSEERTNFQIEIWVADNGMFRWNETIRGPNIKAAHIGVMSVVDIDQSKKMDLVLPVCLSDDCLLSRIYVYNHSHWVEVKMSMKLGVYQWGFVPPDAPHPWYLDLPIMMRMGDINLDGYPDYVTVLRLCQPTGSCLHKAFLLLNEHCKPEDCGDLRQTFVLMDSAPIAASRNTKDLIAAFFDTSENGKLDIFMTTYTDRPILKAYKYMSDLGAYFLKIMVVSGKCRQPCIHGDKSLGVNLPGPTTYYETLKTNGNPQYGIATQLSQSAYLSLQLPYVIYGLGQAPNAVDRLMVGVSRDNASSMDLNRTWTYVVPNTQMIIIPSPQESPQRWKSRLFMTPSQLVLLTAAALSGTFGLIVIIAAALHWREHVLDKRERLQESQKFHFDAM